MNDPERNHLPDSEEMPETASDDLESSVDAIEDSIPEAEIETISAAVEVSDEIFAADSASGLEGFAAQTQALFESDFDAEAALNALIAGQLAEPAPLPDAETTDRPAARKGLPALYERVDYQPALAMPGFDVWKPGSLGSVVAGLVLIALGAWLTLANTSGAPPAPWLVAAAVLGGITLSLLAHWLGGGRWNRGSLFFALLVLISAGIVLSAVQFDLIDLVRGWPLFVIGAGAAALISAAIGRPLDRRLVTVGILLVFAGLFALIMTNLIFPSSVIATAAAAAPVVLVVVVILWILPLVVRRRN